MSGYGYTVFDTAIGRCGIAWGEFGVIGVQLPEAREIDTRRRLYRLYPEAREQRPPREQQPRRERPPAPPAPAAATPSTQWVWLVDDDKLQNRGIQTAEPAPPPPPTAEEPGDATSSKRRRRRRGGVRQHADLPGNRGKHLAGNGDKNE